MNFRVFRCYKWVYLLGVMLTLTNAIFLHSAVLLVGSLVGLYCILFYKGVHILKLYRSHDNGHESIPRKLFDKSYRVFRVRVALFWLAFIGLCVLSKFVFHLGCQYFYSCTFFFLFVDKFFVNKICLLQKFSDPTGTMVLCCCGCPCRGWDLMLIHTPLLFALSAQSLLQNSLILFSSIFAVLSFILWEIHKYHLVEVRQKCAIPCDLKLCREYL